MNFNNNFFYFKLSYRESLMGVLDDKISKFCNKLYNYFSSNNQNISIENKQCSILSNQIKLLSEPILNNENHENYDTKKVKKYIELKEYRNDDFIISKNLPSKKSKSLKDFEILRLIGEGSFGKVFLAKLRESKNNKQYAMKIIEKENVIKWKQENNIFTERYILQNLNHPFISKLSFAFQDYEKLYLITDFMPGGDLMHKLISYGKLSERISKLYASELFLAIDFLHKNDIIFRDLKPDNILLDEFGHIKLTDFGLSKKLNCDDNINDLIKNKKNIKRHKITYSICGTPNYIAPEVYEGIGYSKEIDWWSFGIVIYEMLTGKFPFKKKNKDNTFYFNQKINFNLKFPLSNDAIDLIEKLLENDIQKRLIDPYKIMNHNFFKGINWDDVYNKRIEIDNNNSNISNKSVEEQLNENFDKKFIENKIEVEKISESKNKDNNYLEKNYSSFQNFSFACKESKEEIIA